MNVLAFSTPRHPDWRWRIIDYNGEMVEESYTAFPTIAAAVAGGYERLRRNTEREGPLLLRRGR
jgi:hypothetical protein